MFPDLRWACVLTPVRECVCPCPVYAVLGGHGTQEFMLLVSTQPTELHTQTWPLAVQNLLPALLAPWAL